MTGCSYKPTDVGAANGLGIHAGKELETDAAKCAENEMTRRTEPHILNINNADALPDSARFVKILSQDFIAQIMGSLGIPPTAEEKKRRDQQLIQILSVKKILSKDGESIGEVRTIEDVIKVMNEIDKLLPEGDGLKYFNMLYKMVTEAILERCKTNQWKSPEWLFHLDVEFGKIYFENILQCLIDPEHAPESWMVLMNNRYKEGIAKVQFGLVGICSHIMRDLMLATMRAYELTEKSGSTPSMQSNEFDDYTFINNILDEVELKAMQEMATGIIKKTSKLLQFGNVALDREIVMRMIRRERNIAFKKGLFCYRIRKHPEILQQFIKAADKRAAYYAKLLLFPTESWVADWLLNSEE